MSRRFQILVVFVILAFLSSGLINPSTNRASSQKLKPMKGFWQPLSTTTLGPKALIDHHESNNPVYMKEVSRSGPGTSTRTDGMTLFLGLNLRVYASGCKILPVTSL
jgi:hypothetical protein